MTGLVRLAQARHLPECLAITAVLAVACAAWPSAGIVADYSFAGTPRGVSLYELSAVALAVVVPALSLGATTQAERLSRDRRVVLSGFVAVLLVLPLVPFGAWLLRVTFFLENPEPWESPVPVLASLLLYAVAGLLAVRFVGMILGSLAVLAAFVTLVVVQNQEGSDVLASTFSTARDWHWNPWVTAVAVVAAAVAMWLTHGTNGLLADTDTGGHTR